MLLVERWILARLRHRTFFASRRAQRRDPRAPGGSSTPPLQEAPGSRGVFEKLDRPALQPLPATPLRVRRVEDGPRGHRLPRRARAALLQRALPAGARSSSRCAARRPPWRSSEGQAGREPPEEFAQGRHTTLEHMPQAHQESPSGRRAAGALGGQKRPHRAALVELIQARAHPQQGFRAALGILRLGKRYGEERLEAACRRAATSSPSATAVSSRSSRTAWIAKPVPRPRTASPDHGNVRGAAYYH